MATDWRLTGNGRHVGSMIDWLRVGGCVDVALLGHPSPHAVLSGGGRGWGGAGGVGVGGGGCGWGGGGLSVGGLAVGGGGGGWGG